MNTLQSRLAQLSDLPRIVEIYNASIPSRIVTADLEPVSIESRIPWFEAHSAERRPLWVFENTEGKIYAWASFQAFYTRKAYDSCVEVSIYLAPEAQGKGLGTEILAFCIDQAKARALRTLLGFIFKSNTASQRLFEKFGFTTWGTFPEIAEMEDRLEDLIILGKRI
jgi:phosphinothricin acetyltransferase